jgi:translation initiation factor IF-3
MRGAANFNPEWGYLAPAPSFMRTVRIVVVAAAVGASAGAAVVFSLVDRPAAEESVAARTLAVEPAAAPLAAPAVVQLPAQDERQPQSAAEAGSASTVQRPAGIAALAESPPATDAAPARVPTAPNGTTLQNTPIKPQLGWRSPAPASARAVRGPLALLPSPGARAATGTNPPRVVN